MKRIVLFDPSYGTYNTGDYIIKESAVKELSFVLEGNYIVNIGTHNPVWHSYQMMWKKNYGMRFVDNADFKFLLGTNIIKKNMLTLRPDWNVNIFNHMPYIGTILVGAGLGTDFNKVNAYTKGLYKRILNKDYYHSVRDEKTKVFLESIGVKAINTGCVTTWDIDEKLCKKIPSSKSKDVIFTITDYSKDISKDTELISTLKENYDKVYFWPQGIEDYWYVKTISEGGIISINPGFESYKQFLENNNVDYVGTRLHAGIFAIKHARRSIIVAVDNRAREMNRDFSFNMVEREEIERKLAGMINTNLPTLCRCHSEAINEWKGQFS